MKLKIFSRLNILSSVNLRRVRETDVGFVDPSKFFNNNNIFLSKINKVLSPIFGSDWAYKQYQDNPSKNLSSSAEFYIKSRITPGKKLYIGDGLIGIWYENFKLENGDEFYMLMYDEPTSIPTKSFVINDKDVKYVNNL